VAYNVYNFWKAKEGMIDVFTQNKEESYVRNPEESENHGSDISGSMDHA
jgi:hypothetical protein